MIKRATVTAHNRRLQFQFGSVHAVQAAAKPPKQQLASIIVPCLERARTASAAEPYRHLLLITSAG